MSDLAEGQVIAGRYRLERLLGEGGMGAVWAATDGSSGATVALKFMKGAALTNPEMHKRFIREARAAGAVKHPCVVKIHEIVRDDLGAPVMVMDFLAGESLGSLLERVRPMQLRDFARIFLQVVSAVGTAHAAGIVHRDLKPDNIFLVASGGTDPDVRILDFGIAKLTALEGDAAQTAGLTDTGAMLGTPYYMSPEQVFGDKSIDHRADIWSLGVILFEALSGTKPVNGESLGQLLRVITTGGVPRLEQFAPHLPREVLDLSTRMLTLDKAHRPQDLREVYETFRKYTSVTAQDFAAATVEMSRDELASAGFTGAPFSATAASQPARGSPKGALVAAAALAIAGIGGTAWFLRTRSQPPTEAPAVASPAEPRTVASLAAQPFVVSASSAAPSASASTVPSASNVATKPVKPKSASTTAATSITTATTTTTTGPAAPTSTTQKPGGGVASELPF